MDGMAGIGPLVHRVCIGIDMIFHGWGWMMLALSGRATGTTNLPGSYQRTRSVSA